jgi:hypothetical protein
MQNTMDTAMNTENDEVQTLKNDNMALMHALDGFINQLNCKVVGVAKSIEDPGSKLYVVRLPSPKPPLDTTIVPSIPIVVSSDNEKEEVNKKYMEQQALQSVLLTRFNALTHRQRLMKNTVRRAQSILLSKASEVDTKSRSKLAGMYSHEELKMIIDVYNASEKARNDLKQSIAQCKRRATCLMNKYHQIANKPQKK